MKGRLKNRHLRDQYTNRNADRHTDTAHGGKRTECSIIMHCHGSIQTTLFACSIFQPEIYLSQTRVGVVMA